MIFQPKNRDELKEAIKLWCNNEQYAFTKYGNIRNWDTSKVTDMSEIFAYSQFNGDISKWDTSSVTDMSDMFSGSKFNGNISNWETSKVTNMSEMFYESKFDGDISKWNTSNITNMKFMFTDSDFNGDISKWNTSNVTNMKFMFYNSQFNGDISKWDTSSVTDMSEMFYDSKFNGDVSNWNFSNLEHGINNIGIKIVKKWIIVKVDKKDIECCVLFQPIKNEFIKCSTCNKCFDISIKKNWIDNKNSCPMCTLKWTNNKVYLME